MAVKFIDNRIEVTSAIEKAAIAFLTEVAGELTSQVARNSRVDLGQLKNSWEYKLKESEFEAYVGSPLENAIWEEFGTGEYAIHGDGRKTPWFYTDRNGEGHWTRGKTPSRAFENAKTSVAPKAEKIAKEKFGDL